MKTTSSCNTLKLLDVPKNTSLLNPCVHIDTGHPIFNTDVKNLWSDGENVYHSNGSSHYAYDRGTKKWRGIAWKGLSEFYGNGVWTDGANIYYSTNTDGNVLNYKLNKETGTWEEKVWQGHNSFNPIYFWTDGEHICYTAYDLDQVDLILNGDTWETIDRGMSAYSANSIWSDGTDIYHKTKRLDRETGQWGSSINMGLDFSASEVITDGIDTYVKKLTGSSPQPTYTLYKFDKENKKWTSTGYQDVYYYMAAWSDGKYLHAFKGRDYFVLPSTSTLYSRIGDWEKVGKIT